MNPTNTLLEHTAVLNPGIESPRKSKFWLDRTFLLLAGFLVAVFVLRTLLAVNYPLPRFNDLFTVLAGVGSLIVLFQGYHSLQKRDWVTAITLGGVVGIGMYFATLASPYPFWGVVRDNLGQAYVRGIVTTVAALGGLAIMRQGGPVQIRAAMGGWSKLGASLVLGLLVGLPLAVLNILALQLTEGKPIVWQAPQSALLDALQPGVVEEVVYRFALLGLFWLLLRKSQPVRASWLAGFLTMLVHACMHFDDLFLQAPLVALGMGLVMAFIWGLPPTILALRRDLDSAITFHWIQDVARFLAGF